MLSDTDYGLDSAEEYNLMKDLQVAAIQEMQFLLEHAPKVSPTLGLTSLPEFQR